MCELIPITLRTNYVLIDFENVQPGELKIEEGIPMKVLIFAGEKQSKVPIDLAKSIQPLGEKVEYVQIAGNGKNALDFHIAYYIGKIAEKDPNSYFHIISKDKGFDPLIKHLKANKVLANRAPSVSEIPALKSWFNTTMDQRIEVLVEYLKSRGNARPRKVKTLQNSIKVLFANNFKDNEVTAMVNRLVNLKYVILDGQKVGYQLPDTSSVE